MLKFFIASLVSMVFSLSAMAVEYEDHDGMLMNHGDGHLMDMGGGMVMGQNTETLPGGCERISETKEITVHAGHKFAEKFPGRMFAFDTQEFNFKPCTKLTVHFYNDDKVRHQWMMHGLPKYLYPQGMFHLEVSGPGKISGTLILPPGDKTYLVHCDIAQHMEKGMKAELKVGKGDGDLPSIPGLTAPAVPDDYSGTLTDVAAAKKAGDEAAAVTAAALAATKAATAAATAQQPDDSFVSGITVIGLAIGLLLAPFLAKKFKGMTSAEIIAYIFDLLRVAIDYAVRVISALIKIVAANKNKVLPEK
ncbi:MAG: copper oxidase [Methylococcales bacterium]|nr:copper oxidase [Methylococcaceae bacterium]